jgi:2-dehydro-3-deoxy-D-arabinonate dehydratase
MKLYRTAVDRWVVENNGALFPLGADFSFDAWLADENPLAAIAHLARSVAPAPRLVLPASPLAPISSQEIWAAGVTYQRSRVARMEESVISKSAYDLVYDAPRPEIFFKGTPGRCRSTGEAMRLRDDSKWMVPEPELALIVSARGQVVGYTAGNDLSCRDIEGENLLYLPQAKTWDGSCSLGPAILLAGPSVDVRSSAIRCAITRGGREVFGGETKVSQIKRAFGELVGYLFRNQTFANGVVLLTGTGIVPPNEFSLVKGDVVRIEIEGVGVLENEMG